ncbi:MAG: hypothetical protein WCL18_09760 [bacterium]
MLVFLSLLIYQSISKKKILSKKTISLVVLAFVLAMGAFVVKEWRYYGDNAFTTVYKSSTTSWSPSFIKEDKIVSLV